MFKTFLLHYFQVLVLKLLILNFDILFLFILQSLSLTLEHHDPWSFPRAFGEQQHPGWHILLWWWRRLGLRQRKAGESGCETTASTTRERPCVCHVPSLPKGECDGQLEKCQKNIEDTIGLLKVIYLKRCSSLNNLMCQFLILFLAS